jgi:hypothetical protein
MRNRHNGVKEDLFKLVVGQFRSLMIKKCRGGFATPAFSARLGGFATEASGKKFLGGICPPNLPITVIATP